MTLVDTSVWIDHFRVADEGLVTLLHDGHVAIHPFVMGELALGTLPRRADTLEWLAALPALPLQPEPSVLEFAERHRLAGSGIGWVDAHLLAAADAAGVRLLTSDKKLHAVAARLGLAAR